MSLDLQRGIVYIPTGSAVFDFYGGDRTGNDLFANTLLALDAATGRRIWHFQGVHHDIWDRDFPAPPALVTLNRNGRRVDAIAQTTKQGYLYVFDRATGAALFPIEELAYPKSDVPGEVTAATQPKPISPEPYARQTLTEDMLTTRTAEAHAWAFNEFKTFRSGGQFLPLTLDKQTIVFPGFDGGAEWGGPAVDPTANVLYVNANEMAWTGALTLNKPGGSPGETAYQSQCAVCHGTDRVGSPPAFPSLVGIDKRLTDQQIIDTIHQGKGRMPSLPNLDSTQVSALIAYLKSGSVSPAGAGRSRSDKVELTSVSTAVSNPLGAEVYQRRCAICHGDQREGIPPSFPMLVGVGQRLSVAQIVTLIHEGKGRMPGQPNIQAAELDSLLRYLGVDLSMKPNYVMPGGGALSYRFTGYQKFLDPDGYPAIAPPWGTLNAIDLNTGKYLWKIPLGEYPALAAKGMKNTGSENYGGPIVTAGGVLFIAATVYDRKFRAFDSSTGNLLWETELPFAGVATPSTYSIDGKQYVVVACSGGRDPKSPTGGMYVAFALP
jgi:mono/diheme cytochrome c family protein